MIIHENNNNYCQRGRSNMWAGWLCRAFPLSQGWQVLLFNICNGWCFLLIFIFLYGRRFLWYRYSYMTHPFLWNRSFNTLNIFMRLYMIIYESLVFDDSVVHPLMEYIPMTERQKRSSSSVKWLSLGLVLVTWLTARRSVGTLSWELEPCWKVRPGAMREGLSAVKGLSWKEVGRLPRSVAKMEDGTLPAFNVVHHPAKPLHRWREQKLRWLDPVPYIPAHSQVDLIKSHLW